MLLVMSSAMCDVSCVMSPGPDVAPLPVITVAVSPVTAAVVSRLQQMGVPGRGLAPEHQSWKHTFAMNDVSQEHAELVVTHKK